jgi:REP element-mobilizing transposase RayT
MKPGSFTQIYVQLIIAVKNKSCGLENHFRQDVFKIMGGILNEMGHKPILINGMNDHVHIFLGMNPKISLSETVKELKRRTTVFINGQGYCNEKFQWQNGYGAFSYSRSHIDNVYRYIKNQENHHMKRSFEREYRLFLKKYEVEHDERFLFQF